MEEPLSFDEKFISNIFKKYTKAKIILQRNFTNLQEKERYYGRAIISNNFSASQLSNYYHHLQIVETILSLLPKEEYMCIVRDFLNNKKSKLNSDEE